MAKSRNSRFALTRETLPAWSFTVLGFLMLAMPSLIEHAGYQGDVIIARDTVDPAFQKKIILIGQESVDGGVGIILNQALTDEQRAKLSPFIRDSGIPVNYGGPFDVSEKLFVIEEKRPATAKHDALFEIRTWDNAVSRTPDLLEKIRASLKLGEERYRVFTGYTPFGPFELEQQVWLRNNWRAQDTTHDVVFQSTPAGTWEGLSQADPTKQKALTTPNQI